LNFSEHVEHAAVPRLELLTLLSPAVLSVPNLVVLVPITRSCIGNYLLGKRLEILGQSIKHHLVVLVMIELAT
jgi:hypothetical protein